jgi:[acyl-carrier-protein] S-malonyltransferase
VTIALTFPGQGSQKPGMGAAWVGTPSWDRVAEISGYAGRDAAVLLLDTEAEELARTDNAQLATFALEMVLLDAVRGTGLEFAAAAGHSLGEYSALVAAGILDLADAARLVAARGAAMAEAAQARPGTMAVLVNLDAATATGLTEAARARGGDVWVANINGPGQVVVSGTRAGVADVEIAAAEAGGKAIRIPVGGAFHSPLMEPAAGALGAALDAASPRPGNAPVVANVDATAHRGDADWRGLLRRQLVEPVRWEETLHVLVGDLGCRLVVELGPGRTLAGLAKRVISDTPHLSVSTPESVQKMSAQLSDLDSALIG